MSKFVYIDESGISVNESVLVVTGIIVDTESQLKAVAEYLDLLHEKFVKEEDRDGFVFHATDIFRRTGKVFGQRDKYSTGHCHAALASLLNIPAKFRLSVVYGFVHKGPPPKFKRKFAKKGARIEAGVNHSMGFSLCSAAAEAFMQKHARPNEIATLIAENNTDTRKAVKEAHKILQGRNLTLKHQLEIFELLSRALPGGLPLKKIVGAVHMVEKHEESILQVADACALIIRYCLEGKPDAKDLIDRFTQGHPEKLLVEGQNEGEAGFNFLVFSPPS